MSHATLEGLWAELGALEQRAGISEAVEDAKLGPLFTNTDGSPTEYWDDVEDYARRKIRELYFEVPEEALRKELIAKRRECDQAIVRSAQTELHSARVTLAQAQGRLNALPWQWAGLAALGCVAVGASIADLYGAIGGAVLGFFLGQGVIQEARNNRALALRLAKEDFDRAVENEREGSIDPEWFSQQEEHSGQRDHEMDYQSVIANRAQMERESKSRLGSGSE